MTISNLRSSRKPEEEEVEDGEPEIESNFLKDNSRKEVELKGVVVGTEGGDSDTLFSSDKRLFEMHDKTMVHDDDKLHDEERESLDGEREIHENPKLLDDDKLKDGGLESLDGDRGASKGALGENDCMCDRISCTVAPHVPSACPSGRLSIRACRSCMWCSVGWDCGCTWLGLHGLHGVVLGVDCLEMGLCAKHALWIHMVRLIHVQIQCQRICVWYAVLNSGEEQRH